MADVMGIAAQIAAAELAEIKIIDELRGLLPALTDEARKELRISIEQEGIRDPLTVWKEENAIVDGFNRYELAKELGIVPPVQKRSFKDIHDAKKWMLRNQLGRRNLTPEERTYFIGQLYNEEKTDKPSSENNKLVDKIAEQFAVSPKTVRRAAEVATGIDMIAKVRGAAAKAKELSGKGTFTKAELAEVGKASSPTVASRALEVMQKAKANPVKVAAPKPAPKKPEVYKGAFLAPEYGPLFNAANHPKPNLDKDAYVFIVVPDEHMQDAFTLSDLWGLVVEGQVIYIGNEKYEGVFTRIDHTSLFICTKGTVIGPDKGKEVHSVQHVVGDPINEMLKLAESYIRNGKKIDMRKKGPAKGWDGAK